MRKILIICLLLMVVIPSEAKGKKEPKAACPYKYEFNIAWGYVPGYTHDETRDMVSSGNTGLDHIYGNYLARKSSGLMSADFNIQFKRWFALGLQLNAVVMPGREYSPITENVVGKYTDFEISFLPYARFTYLNRELVKLYSSIGLGLRMDHDEAPSENVYNDPGNYWMPCLQFVPVGVTVGKKVYGLFELGMGSEYMGCRFGVGYRF